MKGFYSAIWQMLFSEIVKAANPIATGTECAGRYYADIRIPVGEDEPVSHAALPLQKISERIKRGFMYTHYKEFEMIKSYSEISYEKLKKLSPVLCSICKRFPVNIDLSISNDVYALDEENIDIQTLLACVEKILSLHLDTCVDEILSVIYSIKDIYIESSYISDEYLHALRICDNAGKGGLCCVDQLYERLQEQLAKLSEKLNSLETRNKSFFSTKYNNEVSAYFERASNSYTQLKTYLLAIKRASDILCKEIKRINRE
ncbi:hypothetical protein ENBRE01_1202 [Enteropsectra breve]|nr:hypothetical protein ENBRE01_1202 [Enteropsectra breve]